MVSAGELHVDATEEVSNKELDPAYTGSNLIGQLMITLYINNHHLTNQIAASIQCSLIFHY